MTWWQRWRRWAAPAAARWPTPRPPSASPVWLTSGRRVSGRSSRRPVPKETQSFTTSSSSSSLFFFSLFFFSSSFFFFFFFRGFSRQPHSEDREAGVWRAGLGVFTSTHAGLHPLDLGTSLALFSSFSRQENVFGLIFLIFFKTFSSVTIHTLKKMYITYFTVGSQAH